MVLLAVIARPAGVRCTRPASASAAAATADRPAAGPGARADRRDRRARAASGRDRRRASARDGAAWIACSCHSCAAARACRLARRACASSVPARRGDRAHGQASQAATPATGCPLRRRAVPRARTDRTARIARPAPAVRFPAPRRRRGSVREPRPSRRTRAARADEPAIRAAMCRYVDTLARITEIAAARVRVVTYPVPGFIHHDVVSSTPAAGGPSVRPPGRLDGCKRHAVPRCAGTTLALVVTRKEVRS